MGSALGVKIDFSGAKVESKEIEVKDDRKRNSLAFYISQFVEYEEDDFVPLIEAVRKDKTAKNGGKPPTIRNSSKLPESPVSQLNIPMCLISRLRFLKQNLAKLLIQCCMEMQKSFVTKWSFTLKL